MTPEERKANVNKFVRSVVEAACDDARQGAPERATQNTGDILRTRLNLDRFRCNPRTGDGKYARSIYTAARFLYDTERQSHE